MNKRQIFLTIVLLVSAAQFGLAQKRSDKNPVTYEELYDEPYAINKLFVAFQPIYGDVYAANVNAGFGLEATYFLKDKFDFRVHGRKAYTKEFDVTRNTADKNSDVENETEVFNYFELGATYHIKDFDQSGKTKMFLYKKSYSKSGKWASRVPLSAEIPCTVRKIYGARLGGMYFDTTIDANRVLRKQDKDLSVFAGLPATQMTEGGQEEDTQVFTSMAVGGVYVGGSMAWIKNVAVDFDNKYQEGIDDLIFTAFLDIIIAPSVGIQDIQYDGMTFSSDPIDTNIFGFRLGMDGKFNRTLGWSYGGEIGMRPGLKGRGFYALVKISFPVYSTNLDYSVEAFGK